MRHVSIYNALLSLSAIRCCAGQHDNFLVSFDNDLRNVFGVRKQTTKAPTVPVRVVETTSKEKDPKKVLKQVSVDDSVHHDFDHAERSIFHTIESAEKAILRVASNLIHDEVEVLFGADHGSSIHCKNEEETSTKQEGMGRRKKNITNRRSMKAKNTSSKNGARVSSFHGVAAITDAFEYELQNTMH